MVYLIIKGKENKPMTRRDFVKNAALLGLCVAIPIPFSSKSRPVNIGEYFLDNIAELYGLMRKPSTPFTLETDEDFRKRLLASIRT
jgi:hypothetical protein